jgi:hypothetical protein
MDQGAQFTATDFLGLLEKSDRRISMESRCRFHDNTYLLNFVGSASTAGGIISAVPSLAASPPIEAAFLEVPSLSAVASPIVVASPTVVASPKLNEP